LASQFSASRDINVVLGHNSSDQSANFFWRFRHVPKKYTSRAPRELAAGELALLVHRLETGANNLCLGYTLMALY
jgi:hypothetical protein